jgi:hypothetical protein
MRHGIGGKKGHDHEYANNQREQQAQPQTFQDDATATWVSIGFGMLRRKAVHNKNPFQIDI